MAAALSWGGAAATRNRQHAVLMMSSGYRDALVSRALPKRPQRGEVVIAKVGEEALRPIGPEDQDPYEGAAQWLAESGRRPWPDSPAQCQVAARESSEELLTYLEECAGRPLRSRAAIKQYVADLRSPSQVATARKLDQLLRETALLAMLTVAVLQYYYMDVFLQIGNISHLAVYLPSTAPHQVRR
ncbi:MAG: hypothetical protein IVW54_17815 [Candidatus Binataceae bacterium]|nr:hypothetical protein [Candidatus Binataceae bacterium]